MVAATDIVTVSEASAYLQAPADTALVELWISAVSNRLDDLCGPVVARTVTDSLTACDGSVILTSTPIYSITSVTEYTGTTAQVLTLATNASQPTTGYHLNTANGILSRRSGSGAANFPSGTKNIEVVYSAGRYASTATVTERFKRACLIAVSHVVQSDHGTRNQTFGGFTDEGVATFGPGWVIPRRALDLLGNELIARIGIA